MHQTSRQGSPHRQFRPCNGYSTASGNFSGNFSTLRQVMCTKGQALPSEPRCQGTVSLVWGANALIYILFSFLSEMTLELWTLPPYPRHLDALFKPLLPLRSWKRMGTMATIGCHGRIPQHYWWKSLTCHILMHNRASLYSTQ